MSAPAQAWYVVHTRPHQEVKAAQNLERQNFGVYLPRYLRRRSHARRVEQVARPLYPRYLFVTLDPTRQRWRAINSTFGVVGLICRGDAPAPMDDGIIAELKEREDERGLVRLEPASRLRPGDAVRVLDGAFASCLGLFEGISDSDRVAILLDMLGRKVRIMLNGEAIEPAT